MHAAGPRRARRTCGPRRSRCGLRAGGKDYAVGMSLCLDCGLCCDGTLFHAVPIAREEAERLGARVRLTADGKELLQSCRALEGCRCGVYEDRPSTCRQYRCLVLTAFESGQLDEKKARAALQEIFALRREVVKLNGGSTDERKALEEAREKVPRRGDDQPELRAALARLNRAALVLQLPAALFGKEG